MLGIALIGALVEASQNWYFRRLLQDVPRWPLLLHRGAPSRAAIVDAVSRRADVMAYQHMFAIAAAVMLIVAAGIAAYGLWESRAQMGRRLKTAAQG